MGIFTAKLQIASVSDPGRREELEAMIDTGASYSWISRRRLNALGVRATGRMQFRTIEGHTVEREVAPLLVTIDGRTGGDTVVMAEDADMEVWGAMTLEALGVAADPLQKRLVPTVGMALACVVERLAPLSLSGRKSQTRRKGQVG